MWRIRSICDRPRQGSKTLIVPPLVHRLGLFGFRGGPCAADLRRAVDHTVDALRRGGDAVAVGHVADDRFDTAFDERPDIASTAHECPDRSAARSRKSADVRTD